MLYGFSVSTLLLNIQNKYGLYNAVFMFWFANHNTYCMYYICSLYSKSEYTGDILPLPISKTTYIYESWAYFLSVPCSFDCKLL